MQDKEDYEVYYNHARPVDVNRNEIVNYFLDESDHDVLWMIDSDITPPDNAHEILDYEFDIISPIVFSTKGGVPYPVATEYGEDGNYRMYAREFDELIDVEGVGAGCIAITREVLEDMSQPVFEFTKSDNGELNTSEDFNFCVCANEAGYSVKVATDYVCGHVSEVDLYDMMNSMALAMETNKEDIFVERVGGKNEDEA